MHTYIHVHTRPENILLFVGPAKGVRRMAERVSAGANGATWAAQSACRSAWLPRLTHLSGSIVMRSLARHPEPCRPEVAQSACRSAWLPRLTGRSTPTTRTWWRDAGTLLAARHT